MRIDEPIETSGFFWLPEEPDVRVPGTLRILESGEASLEVQFQEESASWSKVIGTGMSVDGYEVPRILGIGAQQGLITLDKCIVTNSRVSSTTTELTLSARLALTGCHYGPGEELTFTEFAFSTEGIDEWLAVSGIDVQFDWANMRSSVEVRIPDDIHVELPNETKLKFTFRMTYPSCTRTITEAHIIQKAFVHLSSSQPRPVEYFTSLATKLRNFLRLAIGQPVSIDSAIGYTPEVTWSDGSGNKNLLPIKIYYRDTANSSQKEEVIWFRMLFRYPDVEGQIKEMLANWLHGYDVFGPALDIYFAAMSNTSQYLEVEFLQRVQCIETLHRRSFLETEMPKDEFAGMMDSLLLVCPSGRREWLKGRLRYANEPSLRRRLRAMVEPFGHLFADTRKQKAFVDKVVITRNYLTHYDSGLEDQATKEQDLWGLTAGLEALFQLHLLQFIGLDGGHIDRILQGPSNLQIQLTSAGMHVQEVHD